jgi:precorrin-6B methylase 2
VVNAVTLETEALMARHGAGRRVDRIAIARAGRSAQRGWRPALPVTQWSGQP